MNYSKFKKHFIYYLEEYVAKVEPDKKVVVTPINKVNLSLTSITITDNSDGLKVEPMYYLEYLFEEFRETPIRLQDFATSFYFKYENNRKTMVNSNLYKLPTKEDLLKNVFPTAINKELNTVLLKDLLHINLMDISIIFKVFIADSNSQVMSTPVTNELLKLLNINKEEILKAANTNLVKILGIRFTPVIEESFGDLPLAELTTSYKCYGSGFLYNTTTFKELTIPMQILANHILQNMFGSTTMIRNTIPHMFIECFLFIFGEGMQLKFLRALISTSFYNNFVSFGMCILLIILLIKTSKTNTKIPEYFNLIFKFLLFSLFLTLLLSIVSLADWFYVDSSAENNYNFYLYGRYTENLATVITVIGWAFILTHEVDKKYFSLTLISSIILTVIAFLIEFKDFLKYDIKKDSVTLKYFIMHWDFNNPIIIATVLILILVIFVVLFALLKKRNFKLYFASITCFLLLTNISATYATVKSSIGGFNLIKKEYNFFSKAKISKDVPIYLYGSIYSELQYAVPKNLVIKPKSSKDIKENSIVVLENKSLSELDLDFNKLYYVDYRDISYDNVKARLYNNGVHIFVYGETLANELTLKGFNILKDFNAVKLESELLTEQQLDNILEKEA